MLFLKHNEKFQIKQHHHPRLTLLENLNTNLMHLFLVHMLYHYLRLQLSHNEQNLYLVSNPFDTLLFMHHPGNRIDKKDHIFMPCSILDQIMYQFINRTLNISVICVCLENMGQLWHDSFVGNQKRTIVIVVLHDISQHHQNLFLHFDVLTLSQ